MSVESAPTHVLDVEGSLARFGGDEALFCEMTSLLVEDAPPLFAKLQDALLAGDVSAVESKAHALRGLLANCGGMRAAHAAQRLEDTARAGDLQQGAALIQSLKGELESLMAAIHAYPS